MRHRIRINLKHVPVFGGPDDKWFANEELELLNLIKQHGYGNWSLFAENLSSMCHSKEFTPKEVEDHYINTYVEGAVAKAMKVKNSARDLDLLTSLEDHTSNDDDEFLNSVDTNACEVDQTFLEKIGYMPLRGEFRQEYAPTAENLLSDVTFTNVEEYDKNVNLLLLDAYRNKIKERFKLKNAVTKFKLLEQYYAASKREKVQDHDRRSQCQGGATERIREDENLDKKYQMVQDKEESERVLQFKGLLIPAGHSPIDTLQGRKASVRNDDREFDAAEDRLCKDLDLDPTFYRCYRDFLIGLDRKRAAGEFTHESMTVIPEGMTTIKCLRIVRHLEKFGLIKTKNLLKLADE